MVQRLERDPPDLAALLAGKQAVVAGPGLGLDDQGQNLARALPYLCTVPLVLDGDALTAFAGRVSELAQASCPLVLTPHPGEFARLTGVSPEALAGHRLDLAQGCARDCRAVVVLKGAGTVVAAPDGRLAINGSGGPQLAKAGSGDVLAGLLGALLAQGMEPFEAACMAVHVHGLASEQAALTTGHRSLLASETAQAIGLLLDELAREDGHGY
jgi:NAD(P)H-hydrate epimerase